MGQADYYKEGSWNANCSFCGRKRKGDELVLNWQGFWVCPEHNPPRQPQDFVRAVPDNPAAPFIQHPGDDFAEFCTANGTSAVPGYAMPGCMIPDYLSPAFNSEGDPN